jgi:hypothetical protein
MMGEMGLPKLTEISLFLETAWYTKTGLSTVLIFVTAVGVGAGVGSDAPLQQIAIGFALVYSVIVLLWWWTKRPPKAVKNKIGFLVSILCADDATSQKLHEDFIRPLRQLIKSGNTGETFQFMNLPQFLAREVEDHEQAEAMRIRTRAHFMLYGNVRQRLIGGENTHVIHLEGIVAHKSISGHVNRDLVREFSELLPRRLHITNENDILFFQFTSEWTEVVARYVLGIAFRLSGELDYAESLLTDSLQQLAGKNHDFPIYRKLKERIPLRLSEITQDRISQLYSEWMKTRELHLWDQIEILQQEIHPIHQDTPDMIYRSHAQNCEISRWADLPPVISHMVQ